MVSSWFISCMKIQGVIVSTQVSTPTSVFVSLSHFVQFTFNFYFEKLILIKSRMCRFILGLLLDTCLLCVLCLYYCSNQAPPQCFSHFFKKWILTFHAVSSGKYNPSLAEHGSPCLSKQCRSRSVLKKPADLDLHCLSLNM